MIGRAAFLCAALILALPTPSSADSGAAARGAYLLAAGGCASCHTDAKGGGKYLAGGLALKTPFGTFFSPNITSDPETGLGRWSESDFIAAMTVGISPGGDHYFPAFPFTSYTNMTRQDLSDLKTYLDTVPAVSQANKEHDLAFPFGFRFLAGVWKTLFFAERTLSPDPSRSDSWNRGAYLVNGPGHCVECHSPRNPFGALKRDRLLAGTADGPDGEKVPPLTGKKFTWTKGDIELGLRTGMMPNGDFLGGSMGKVVENTTSKLSDSDISAIADYLLNRNQ